MSKEGYVCGKKPLVTAQAIEAYRKAIVGTNIYKFAEDYALVILNHTSIAMVFNCIFTPQIYKITISFHYVCGKSMSGQQHYSHLRNIDLLMHVLFIIQKLFSMR